MCLKSRTIPGTDASINDESNNATRQDLRQIKLLCHREAIFQFLQLLRFEFPLFAPITKNGPARSIVSVGQKTIKTLKEADVFLGGRAMICLFEISKFDLSSFGHNKILLFNFPHFNIPFIQVKRKIKKFCHNIEKSSHIVRIKLNTQKWTLSFVGLLLKNIMPKENIIVV